MSVLTLAERTGPLKAMERSRGWVREPTLAGKRALLTVKLLAELMGFLKIHGKESPMAPM